MFPGSPIIRGDPNYINDLIYLAKCFQSIVLRWNRFKTINVVILTFGRFATSMVTVVLDFQVLRANQGGCTLAVFLGILCFYDFRCL